MEWREVIENPSLRDLPFKIETNEWGQIVMTPTSVKHSRYQGYVIEWFCRFAEGKALPECPIQTSEGVRVADVAWGSAEFFKRNRGDLPCFPEAPEVVVEVKSPSNRLQEMEGKKHLYFEAGAREVWLCDEDGGIRFFSPRGKLTRSELFGEFPEHIDIDFV